MQPIVQWLEALGLGQYGEAFVRADIDAAVLPDLSEADLAQLGVTLGHRKRLLRAIASLSEPGATRPGVPAPPAGAAAERRQLTVLFSDLVGSTALASRLDPVDLRGVIGAYHRCVAAAVRRFDGFVAKYMGDGVLAYFGYPSAHEDDAERAVRAGLAVVEAVHGIAAADPLEVRIGIATGVVVVGDLVGEGEAQEVVGETPNLAARLQALALPDRRQFRARLALRAGGHVRAKARQARSACCRRVRLPACGCTVYRRDAVDPRPRALRRCRVDPSEIQRRNLARAGRHDRSRRPPPADGAAVRGRPMGRSDHA
jgi:class 3 adenylate cyclase